MLLIASWLDIDKDFRMSLESVIAENTKAIKELIDALREANVKCVVGNSSTNAINPNVAIASNVNMDNGSVEQTDAEGNKSDDIGIEEGEKELTYDDVRNATLEFVKSHGKSLTEEILARFNVLKVPQLPKELWQKYLDALATEANKNGN